MTELPVFGPMAKAIRNPRKSRTFRNHSQSADVPDPEGGDWVGTEWSPTYNPEGDPYAR